MLAILGEQLTDSNHPNNQEIVLWYYNMFLYSIVSYYILTIEQGWMHKLDATYFWK